MGHQHIRVKTISAAVTIALYGSVAAQENVVEEVIVTGIKRSLVESMDIKRTSSGVVDAISAEDIGKFPDTNLAESLQRITGVSIDRANNEGNQVTVRGFGPSFNLVTLNGRQMPNSSSLQSAGVSRSFNFREISSDVVSGVEVYKTGRASIYSGGIGSTIDIRTARPFDYDGLVATGSLAGVYDTSVEEGDDITPEFSGMISTTFADDTFGILAAISYSERNSRKDRVGTQGWVRNRGTADKSAIDTTNNPTRAHWAPWTVDVGHWDYERERTNGQLVLQWAPNDNFTTTLDYTFTDFQEVAQQNRMSYWFDNPVGQADANGTMWNPRNPNDELNFWGWEFFDEKENDSIGLNIEWQTTDTLRFALDAHDSTSHSNPNGDFGETVANLKNPPKSVALIGADFVGDIPVVIVDDSTLPGGGYNPANIVSDLYQKRGYEMENNIQQIRLDGVWDNADDGALRAINFGVAWTDYQMDTWNSGTFSFVDVPLDSLDLTFEPIGDTADQFPGTEFLFPFIPKYSANQFVDIIKQEGKFFINPPFENDVQEETLAAFISVDIGGEFNGMLFDVNAGVRWEDTDVTSTTVQPGFVGLNYRHVEELQPIFADSASPQSLTGGYTKILPNFDFRMDFTDELTGRFSYSRTLSRPAISAMFPTTNLSAPRPGDPFRASQGNPNVLPLESDNFDFSLEWYYAEGSYASVGYFKKYVKDFIGAGSEFRTIADVNGDPLTDPSVNPRPGCPDQSEPYNPDCLGTATDPVITWEVSTPGNLEDAEVDGWELNLQHMFGDSGFGGIINATFVSSDAEFDPFDLSTTLALTGLSDSYNIVGFWESDAFQVRLAYNWRDDFLLALGAEPTFTEDYGQFDLSASWAFHDNFTLYLEGLNLTDETVRRHARFREQLIDAEQYGPRYTIGIRGRW